MWLFTRYGFVSIVAHRTQPDALLVRSRAPGVIEHFWPEAVVQELPERKRDYRFRATLPRSQVARVMRDQIHSIDYPDFKSAIRDDDYHDATLRTWIIMKRYQQELERRKFPAKRGDGFEHEARQLSLYAPPTTTRKVTRTSSTAPSLAKPKGSRPKVQRDKER